MSLAWVGTGKIAKVEAQQPSAYEFPGQPAFKNSRPPGAQSYFWAGEIRAVPVRSARTSATTGGPFPPLYHANGTPSRLSRRHGFPSPS